MSRVFAESRRAAALLGALSCLWVLAGATLSGCSVDTSLPSDARIDCSGGQRCPEGIVCRKSGRCQPSSSLDVEAPTVVDGVHVHPDRGTLNTRFEVAFSASEPLGEPPTVLLELGGRQAQLELVSQQEQSYRYSYLTTGSEPEGRRALSVVLVDGVGNEGRNESAALLLDFGAPRVLTASVQPLLERHGEPVELSFEVSEPLAVEPRVHMAEGAAWTLVEQDEQSYRFRYEVDRDRDPDGDHTVLGVFEDVAGNSSEPLELAQVRFDSTAPSVDSELILPERVRAETSWVLELGVSEPLLEPPVRTPSRPSSTWAPRRWTRRGRR